MTRWFGAVPADAEVLDTHLVAAVDRALDGAGVRAERIHTHVDRSGPVAATVVSLLLDTDLDTARTAAVRDRLAAELDGPVAAVDEGTEADGGADPRAVGAARQALTGADGRCVRFPGQDFATGDHTVAELLSRAGLDAVVGIGRAVDHTEVVTTAGFLRPQLHDGALTLLVEPAAGGVLRPAEVRSPHRCCGGH